MAAVSRARQRAAIVALLSGVTGLSSATVFPYLQDENTRTLRGTTYAEVDMIASQEAQKTAGIKQQDKMWVIHVVQWSTTVAKTGDNATRASLQAQFELLLDAVEAQLRANWKLIDSMGPGSPVAMKFGMDFKTTEGIASFTGDGSRIEAWITPLGFVLHT